MPVIELPVDGMTCRSCELRVGKALLAVPGVRTATVSARRGTARVRTDAPVPRARLHQAVEKAGYRTRGLRAPWLNPDRVVWRDLAVAALVLLAGAAALRAAGTGALTDRLGTLVSSGSLAMVVVLGLAAGLSTCMALVGGLVLAVSARHAELHPATTAAQRLRPQLAFNAGRVVGFGLLGALIGLVGGAVTPTGRTLAVATVAVSLVMAGIGLRLTDASPRLSARTSLTLPPRLASALGLDRAGRGYSDGRAALLGAGTFLLPCGFTQAVQVYALSTGSPLRAGLVMSLFAVGTMPGLLGVGGLTSLARGPAAARFFRFAGAAVLAFAAVNLSGALGVLAPALAGPPGPVAGTSVTVSDNVTLTDGVQVLRTRQVAGGYEPAAATVLAGIPVRWEIDSVAVSCASSLYAPDLGIDVTVLGPGVNVLSFTPTEPGLLRYSCAMGMYWGSIEVIEAPST